MKIIDMRGRTVAIPMTCMLRHNTGVHPGYITGQDMFVDGGMGLNF
jgi:hypothetical protein